MILRKLGNYIILSIIIIITYKTLSNKASGVESHMHGRQWEVFTIYVNLFSPCYYRRYRNVSIWISTLLNETLQWTTQLRYRKSQSTVSNLDRDRDETDRHENDGGTGAELYSADAGILMNFTVRQRRLRLRLFQYWHRNMHYLPSGCIVTFKHD